jgi:hypothetical protein
LPIRRAVLAVAALVASLWVYAWNGAPLFYYDTVGYLAQGESILEAVGISPAPPPAGVETAAPGEATAPDGTVAGTRSAVYAVVLAILARAGSIDAGVVLNLAVIWLATWLCARHLARASPAMASSIAILAASAGALPFYVAYLMPDILAPVLILCIAALAAFVDEMGWGEIALVVLLALAAVISHPSHLALAVLLAPVAALSSRRFRTRGVAVALVGALVLVGVSERLLFSYAVERFRQAEVMYLPFLTARLIDDGPGWTYLEARCPDPDFPTCLLHAELSGSDDPRRLDAPVILFLEDPGLGSFANLSEEEQLAVSNGQLDFVAEVVRDAPLAVIGALGANLVEQLAAFRVNMTILRHDELAEVDRLGAGAAGLVAGRLHAAGRGWLEPLAVAQGALYLGAFAVIAALMLGAGPIDRRARAFAGVVLAGLVLNALVCGGISEPADRYGARTAFLLPLVAALLILSIRWANPPDRTEPGLRPAPDGTR